MSEEEEGRTEVRELGVESPDEDECSEPTERVARVGFAPLVAAEAPIGQLERADVVRHAVESCGAPAVRVVERVEQDEQLHGAQSREDVRVVQWRGREASVVLAEA